MNNEPKAITYKQVKTATGDEGSLRVWERIGEITGAGTVPTGIDGDGSVDLTEVSESKREQIDRLLEKQEEIKEDAKAAAKEATADTTKKGK